MAKIEKIKKSRKERRCSKCGKEIHVGDPYFKGSIYRRPDIIACIQCRLKPYEVTTSNYIKNVGALVEDWRETYGIRGDSIVSILQKLGEIQAEVEASLESIPDHLKEYSTGKLLQSRYDTLEEAINELNMIDASAVYSEKSTEAEESTDRGNFDSDGDYEVAVEEETETLYEEELASQIQEALDMIEY